LDGGRLLVACPILPRIANFDDLDPLKMEPGVEVVMIPPGTPIPAQAGLIILPGSKASLPICRRSAPGWDIDILAHHRRGGAILGICGGYQMLGRSIADPLGLEGEPGAVAGLGLLDVETVLGERKVLRGDGTALGRISPAMKCTWANHGPAHTAPSPALPMAARMARWMPMGG
jgi:adenosylcobyric acid synthase